MQNRPRSILAAVDFGDASAHAVACAGFIADRSGAALHLLHAEATEAPAYFTHEQVEELEAQRRSRRAQVERFLTDFGRQHTTHAFSIGVEARPPVDAVLQQAAAVNLVVMGTHGRHGPKRWWLGSVAERVLREVTRPLLIVRADTPESPAAVFRRILVHAAAPLSGTGTLEYAHDLSTCLSGEVSDARYGPIEPALKRTQATLLVVAAPVPRAEVWLANVGEPLVRFCSVPILFVPESPRGDAS